MKKEIQAFVLSGDAFVKKEAKPEAYFQTTEREKMLAYHDNFDVILGEGLLKWQHNVIDRVFGGQVQKSKQRGTLRLDKTTGETVQSLQSESETALISAQKRSMCRGFPQSCLKKLFKSCG